MPNAVTALGDLAGGALETTLAFGIGFALGAALEPAAVDLRQKAWSDFQIRALDPEVAAAIVAEHVEKTAWGVDEAKQSGIDEERFKAVLGEVLNAPGMGELLRMMRRETITADDFVHGLRKAKLETRWDDPVSELRDERLDPAVLAAAIVRGLIHDPGILPVGPPTAVGKVPAFPVFEIDAVKEAAASGYDLARLSVLVGNYGRPMSPDQAATASFRNIIERVDFDRALAEGDIRNEWGDAIYEHARQIPTAHDFIEDTLRGWSDQAAMQAGTALHGMSPEHTALLFRITGRPLSFHQVFIGLRRGGEYGGPTTEIDPAFLKSLRESNIRPEWYNLAWAQRFTYPAAFVLRALTESKDISQHQAETILLYEGWEPELAATVSKKWAAATPSTGSTLTSKAKTSVITALHKSYVNSRTSEATARTVLAQLGEPPAEIDGAIAGWNHERALIREELTPVQIRKAIGQPGRDKAWALERLHERGFDPQDAETFLAE